MRQGDTDRPQPQDILSAFGLLTRLPVPQGSLPPRGGATAWAWPLVGGVIGVIGSLGATVPLLFGLPAGFAAAAALGAQIFATGALHEDGLADTADGLFGGWTRDRRLEIMKDSRIGSYGALALMLIVLARWSAISALCSSGTFWPALIAAGAVSRLPMALMMSVMPNARSAGLSHSVGRPSLGTVAIGAGIAVLLSVLLIGSATLGAVALGAVFCAALAATARARIGGQTGDILGASQQLAEVAALAVLASAM